MSRQTLLRYRHKGHSPVTAIRCQGSCCGGGAGCGARGCGRGARGCVGSVDRGQGGGVMWVHSGGVNRSFGRV